eukprot:GHVR01077391.1.p2 GENE.GHVR01077391.1~~GHVR01077391.1.p2  ORF type:complete len:100 (+),score=0.89 GHVR01077391.1:1176-1475(+)
MLKNKETSITYDALAKIVNTDIVNISHYCCKLKKIKFIDWESQKEGVVVYPKTNSESTALQYHSISNNKINPNSINTNTMNNINNTNKIMNGNIKIRIH